MPDDTLNAIELMVSDPALQGRIRAGAAKKQAEGFPTGDVSQWAFAYRYSVVAAPGWGAAYQYALDTNNPAPGSDPAVITDQQILAQVEFLLTPVQAPIP